MSQNRRGADTQRTHFGFTAVAPGSKQAMVNRVFAQVASRYDLMNDLMSGGLHRLWKDEVINWLAPPQGERAFALLDVAGGTGDIASRFLKAAGEGSSCVVCDISPEMLAAGEERLAGRFGDRLAFREGNAEALPFEDRSFDAYTIAFGIRNVTHLDRALKEARRVLKPGGRFLCLEFSAVDTPLLDRLYDSFSFSAIPALGAIVTGDAAPYRYLVESIRNFPDQEAFKAMIGEAGFSRVSYRNLTGGIAAIHSAWRL
ncbi:MAG: bifunctional demethylmenaquinone methyltransferase/2-methoxy-6-polyprenyl-1,4-benzoquinol methylase UbiE [Hyphomicrobiales bacterium]